MKTRRHVSIGLAMAVALAIALGSLGQAVWATPTQAPHRQTIPDPAIDLVKSGTLDLTVVDPHTQADAGDQINYTFPLEAPFNGDAWSLFTSLVRGQRSRCCAFVDIDRWALCSASPELFFRLEAERLVSRPMKGTAPRGRTVEEDRRSAAWLQASPKNRAENVMIVDMMRHDLGRISSPGSVEVTDLWQLEKYPSLFQLTSTVEARTRAPLSEIFRALFPCASITGAPKIRAMQIIDELEPTHRGVYCGSIGWIGLDGSMSLNIAIRTMVQVDDVAHAYAGGAIVADSVAEDEYQEILAKAAGMFKALRCEGHVASPEIAEVTAF